jgi:hypothetical protein
MTAEQLPVINAPDPFTPALVLTIIAYGIIILWIIVGWRMAGRRRT